MSGLTGLLSRFFDVGTSGTSGPGPFSLLKDLATTHGGTEQEVPSTCVEVRSRR